MQAWLNFYRCALPSKGGGLTEAQSRAAAAPPSPPTLLGLDRHLAGTRGHGVAAGGRASASPLCGAGLTDTSAFGGTEVSLRWIHIHLIGEYPRHCGPADLIRERIDGATGV